MTWEHVLPHVLLPASVAIVAGFGAWRCWRLLRYGRDPRLQKLVWFYALFAASLISVAIWTGEVSSAVEDATGGLHGNVTDIHGAFAGQAERVDVFLLAHHAFMLAGLAVAVQAFSHKRAAPVVLAAIGLEALGPFIPVMLAAEAAMTLYLAVHAVLNHMERRTPGALQVAAGFLLFFAGHLSFFVLHHPGAARTPLGDIFALVGIALLVALVPRPSA